MINILFGNRILALYNAGGVNPIVTDLDALQYESPVIRGMTLVAFRIDLTPRDLRIRSFKKFLEFVAFLIVSTP